MVCMPIAIKYPDGFFQSNGNLQFRSKKVTNFHEFGEENENVDQIDSLPHFNGQFEGITARIRCKENEIAENSFW